MNAGESFEKHLIRSYNSRWPCSTCGKTFKRESYLLKHKRNQHKLGAVVTKTKSTPGPSPAKRKVIKSVPRSETDSSIELAKESDSDNEKVSDWQESPDISLGESDTETDDELDIEEVEGNEVVSDDPDSDNESVSSIANTGLNQAKKEADLEVGRVIRKPT